MKNRKTVFSNSDNHSIAQAFLSGVCSLPLIAFMLLLSFTKVYALDWHWTAGPGFSSSVPSSASGDVYYEYEVFVYAEGDAGGLTYTRLYSSTYEYGTVGGTPTKCRGEAALTYDTVYPICMPVHSHDTTSGSLDCMVSPEDDDGFWDIRGNMPTPSSPDVTSSVAGDLATLGWQVDYIYPASTPLWYFYSSDAIDCSGVIAHPRVYGWSSYYKIIVQLDQGVSLPGGSIPALPPDGGVGLQPPSSSPEGIFGANISGGDFHSLAVKRDGTIWAWGGNGNSQLGDGTTTQRNTPVQVSSISNGIAVAAGGYHSVALKSDGTVWAWGLNTQGQLGDNSTTQRSTPVQVSGLTDVIAIAAGVRSSYALKDDGTVWAWGWNSGGQLGDGTTTQRNTPVQVSSLTDVVGIGGGYTHGTAVKSDGTVWTWGSNGNGALGNNTTTSSSTRVQATGVTDIIAVSGGNGFTLALESDGTVWAWGFNAQGQLGDNSTTDRLTAVQTSSLTGVVGIDAGGSFSIAILDDGTVKSWGDNDLGEIGDGTTTDRLTPVTTGSITGGISVTAGVFHGMALLYDFTLRSWGYNSNGRLGDNSTTTRTSPVTVSGLTL